MCRPLTSITFRSLGLNASIHLSMFGAEFCSTLQQWILLKNRDQLSYGLGIYFSYQIWTVRWSLLQ